MMRVLILILLLALPTLGQTRMTIATAGTAGALYPMGVAMGEALTRHLPGYIVTAEASSGSLENLRLLHEGRVEWGISQSEVAYFAYTGTGVYSQRPMRDLRALFGTITSWVQIFTLESSSINSIPDLRGKRVGVGAPGSGGELAARQILAFYGLDYRQITPEFLPETEMVQALKDGVIAAMISTHPLRSAALTDLTQSARVRLIEIEDEAFYQAHPYFSPKIIPAGTYPNQRLDIQTPTSVIVMYTTQRAREDEVFTLLSALWEHRSQWSGVHTTVEREVHLAQALQGLTTPLHPGAVRFYESQGMEVPEHLRPGVLP